MEKPESKEVSKAEVRSDARTETRSDSKKGSQENVVVQWFKKTGSRIRTFFVEHRNELRKVQWPNRKETATYTTIVVVVSLGLSLFIWIIDQGLAFILRWLIA